MKRQMLLVLAALALVTVGVAAYYRNTGTSPDTGLATATVTRGSVVETVEATGTLEAVTTVEVGTQVSGTIKALYADYNSRVRKGQVIAQLEASLFETQVEQARATVLRLEADVERARVDLEDARAKARRAEELAAKQLIAATDLETARTTVQQGEASLKAAQAQVVQARASLNQNQVNFDHTTIKAPIDGIVISRNVDVGQTVAASMQAPTLFVLAQDLTRMQVNASVDESDIGRIQSGQAVEFRVDAYPDQVFTGTVKQVRLEPVVTQNVVSYVTVVDVPNADLKLKPGMTANVTLQIARNDDVLRVPNAALRFTPTADVFTALGQQAPERRAVGDAGKAGATRRTRRSAAGVWVLAGGRLTHLEAELGVNDGTMTAVLGGGLDEGAQVVTGAGAGAAARPSTSSRSPLLPQRPGTRGGQSTRSTSGGGR